MVQKYFSLAAEGAAIKFSVSSLSLAGGGLIEGIGITPSVESILPSELESRFAFLTEENDPQIIDAMTTLKGGAVSNTSTTTVTTTTTTATTTTTEKAS